MRPFTLDITFNGHLYTLEIIRISASLSSHQYLVKAGQKQLLLEDQFEEEKPEKRWKLKSTNWEIKDPKAASEFILKLEDELEVVLKRIEKENNPGGM